ncbi:hypothetical protein O1L55_07415 [Streptomyces albulus]|nr:hypothetical protein [Streptomyces noursei]
MLVGEVGEVRPLEGDVAGRGCRVPFGELVDARDQGVQAAALLDQRAGDERRALAEEVDDVQAGGAHEGLVEEGGVPGESVGRLWDCGREALRQGGGAEGDGLDVVHGEGAEAGEGGGEGVGDGRLLVRGDRALAGAGGPDGAPHQFRGEFAQVLVGEGAPLALEGDEGGDADGGVDEAGARALLDEELPDERCDDAGREPDAQC